MSAVLWGDWPRYTAPNLRCALRHWQQRPVGALCELFLNQHRLLGAQALQFRKVVQLQGMAELFLNSEWYALS